MANSFLFHFWLDFGLRSHKNVLCQSAQEENQDTAVEQNDPVDEGEDAWGKVRREEVIDKWVHF